MKKLLSYSLSLISGLFILFSLTGCSIFNGGSSSKEDGKEYKEEIISCSGKWFLLDENKAKTDTYFEFDGSKDNMSFIYNVNNEQESEGTFRIIYRKNTGENASTLSIGLNKKGANKEDFIYAYADDFETNFTQFTTIKIERDEGKHNGRNYAHIYRISELPYKLGTYVLENNAYKVEKDNYAYKNTYQIPEGTYVLNQNVSLSFVMPKPYSYALFQYKNGSEIVEGVYYTASDKKTIYLYIEHDPYEYIRNEDKDKYDTTFSNHYPPDFYLRGNFELLNGAIVVNDLYHHEYSPTTIEDSIFEFGSYLRESN